MAHGDARGEKWRGNKRMEWVTSKRHMTAERRLARAVQTLQTDVCTARLTVVDGSNPPFPPSPADLNGLVRFVERRNVVSARVPSHFKRSLPYVTDAVYVLFFHLHVACTSGIVGRYVGIFQAAVLCRNSGGIGCESTFIFTSFMLNHCSFETLWCSRKDGRGGLKWLCIRWKDELLQPVTHSSKSREQAILHRIFKKIYIYISFGAGHRCVMFCVQIGNRIIANTAIHCVGKVRRSYMQCNSVRGFQTVTVWSRL
jgi:hypothetical protein